MDGGDSGSGSGGYPLLRRESTKRNYNTMASSHRSSSPDSLFVTQDDHYNNEHAAQRPRLSNRLALPRLPPRYPGDGLDFRRPMTSSNVGGSNGNGGRSNDTGVIDLTAEDDMQETTRRSGSIFGEPSGGASRAQRGPRFGRNIIDLESESEAEERPRHSSHAAASHTQPPNYLTLFPPRAPSTTNPHPRFAGLRRPQRAPPFETDMDDLNPGRSRSNARIRLNGDSARGHRSVTPYPNGFAEPIDLTGDDDDVVFVETRAGVNADRPTATAGAGTRSMTDRLNDIRAMTGGGRLFHHLHNLQHALGAFARDTHDPIPHMPAAGPLAIGLEFDLPAFDMGIAGGNQTTADKYEPPAAASKGFTRTPAEDDVLVCPNCGDELAVSEDEKKQEVWIIKKCGHAYCGTCAQYRTKTSRGKGKAPAHRMPLPFRECVVHGCNEKAGAKAMLHVFLGS
ncbi:hypothetical protein CB0940_03376 [Cercospora beticola]|uniref:RING-type domain-containing protein n=1 Tax=Cercospora beticola TaxID=122368 RepID=A0A2G5I4U3_CERBT|nr:hypothetical protein CB0940_03376 [Cercospora beticola]PIA99827.1 hypothetical protein CB0940_03376 [Cercospora beticola]WPB00552.1 hypothetical protein RHO25_005172 [Cercospora beticola]CAK1361231.1 unnamed protein product [Cercospora beticola]